MTTKKEKILYGTTITLTSLWFATSGLFEITKNHLAWDVTLQLGYPPYFIYLLGIAKLIGVAVLLIPGKLLTLKEWVFAGLFFDIIFAFGSNLIILGFPAAIPAIVAFVLVGATYLSFRRSYWNTNKATSILKTELATRSF